jgi:hypothetical protein
MPAPAVPPWWPYRRRSSEHCLTPPSPAASRLKERCYRRASCTATRRGHPTPVHAATTVGLQRQRCVPETREKIQCTPVPNNVD